MDSLIPPVEERKSTSFLGKYKFTLISILIIIAALIPLVIISRQHKQPASTIQKLAQQPVATPTTTPLTQQNAEPTLNAIDTKIQTALDQSNTDLQQASQINTSQDSTAGL